ncbi:MAG TPA: hypothetical protein VHS96_05480 [Bacteroidia bacterium]|nr:hypothetical protein [Bacteroidia bacterium]
MKRNCTLFALFFCLLAVPATLSARVIPSTVVTAESELPWSTVQAVLYEVDDQTAYAYSELVEWYQVGRVTIEEVTEGYLVKILDNDGVLDSILISNL